MTARAFLTVSLLALVACSKKAVPDKPQRPELRASGKVWEIVDGSWHVEGDVLVGLGGHVEAKTDIADGTIEMDIEQVPSATAPSGGNTIGIGFRYSLTYGNLARANGYALNIQNPMFTVVRGANNYWQPVHPDLRGLQRSGLFDPRKNHV